MNSSKQLCFICYIKQDLPVFAQPLCLPSSKRKQNTFLAKPLYPPNVMTQYLFWVAYVKHWLSSFFLSNGNLVVYQKLDLYDALNVMKPDNVE